MSSMASTKVVGAASVVLRIRLRGLLFTRLAAGIILALRPGLGLPAVASMLFDAAPATCDGSVCAVAFLVRGLRCLTDDGVATMDSGVLVSVTMSFSSGMKLLRYR